MEPGAVIKLRRPGLTPDCRSGTAAGSRDKVIVVVDHMRIGMWGSGLGVRSGFHLLSRVEDAGAWFLAPSLNHWTAASYRLTVLEGGLCRK